MTGLQYDRRTSALDRGKGRLVDIGTVTIEVALIVLSGRVAGLGPSCLVRRPESRVNEGRLNKLDFGHSGGVAEGIGDAFAEGWREFRGIDGLPGHG